MVHVSLLRRRLCRRLAAQYLEPPNGYLGKQSSVEQGAQDLQALIERLAVK